MTEEDIRIGPIAEALMKMAAAASPQGILEKMERVTKWSGEDGDGGFWLDNIAKGLPRSSFVTLEALERHEDGTTARRMRGTFQHSEEVSIDEDETRVDRAMLPESVVLQLVDDQWCGRPLTDLVQMPAAIPGQAIVRARRAGSSMLGGEGIVITHEPLWRSWPVVRREIESIIAAGGAS